MKISQLLFTLLLVSLISCVQVHPELDKITYSDENKTIEITHAVISPETFQVTVFTGDTIKYYTGLRPLTDSNQITYDANYLQGNFYAVEGTVEKTLYYDSKSKYIKIE